MADAPVKPATSRVIEAYGAGGFRVDGESHRGSVLILPDGVVPWPVADLADATIETLQPVVDRRGRRRDPADRLRAALPDAGAPGLKRALGDAASPSMPWTPVPPAAPTTCCAPRSGASPRR